MTLTLDPRTASRPDIVDDATRREFIIGAAAFAALFAAGCGDDGGSPDAPAATAGFPRSIEHAEGTTELDAPPQRIYTFGGHGLDGLLALGVAPVCYQAFQPELLPWQRILGMDAVPSVEEDINAELLASLGTEFAMLTNRDWESPAGQSVVRYCPSVTPVQPIDTASMLRLWGQILGREEAAAALIADYERDVVALATPTDFTISLVYVLESGVYVYQRDLDAARTLELGGFALKQFPDTEESFELSTERLGELDTDVLVLIQPYGPDGAAEALQQLALFQALPAVEAGRFVALDTVESSALLFPTTLALPTVAQLFERLHAL